MAKFSIVANGIYASVQDAGLSFTPEGLTVKNGKIIVQNAAGEDVFKVDVDGNLSFKGNIDSQKGYLSGWVLEDDELISKERDVGIHSGERRKYGNDNSPVRFWAGIPKQETTIAEEEEILPEYYNFAVTEAGTLYAKNADIQGNIIADRGRILGNFYVGPDDNTGIIISKDNNNKYYIGSMRYASGAFGGGWTIRSDGSAEFNNVSVRGKITSSVFEYNHISSVGGSLYIAPTIYTTKKSNKIAINNKGENKYKVTWELDTEIKKAFGDKDIGVNYKLLLDGNVYIDNKLQHLSNVELTTSQVGDASGLGYGVQNMLQVTFDSPLNLTGAEIEPGAAIVYYGTDSIREGLYLTAMGADSPYLEIYSSKSNEDVPIPAARLGNLNGITDASFAAVGGALSGYGLYSSNAFLRGQLMLPSAGITNQTNTLYEGSPIRIWAGEEATNDIRQANFIVTEDGSLYARKGTFEGVVKATNSEFSGNIRAAGILLEENDKYQDDALHDHFYVAYNITEGTNGVFKPSYKNYVLNIDKNGLSIWEGGLQAYSDVANTEGSSTDYLSAYKSDDNGKAYPYLYLVDSGVTELTSRMVVNKLHSLTFTPKNGTYSFISTQLNNGIWFNKGDYSGNMDCANIELSIFGQQNAGITLFDKEKMLIQNGYSSGSIHVKAVNGMLINAEDEDESTYAGNALMIRGNAQLVSNETVNFRINGAVVEEVQESGKTIGLNFIATVS